MKDINQLSDEWQTPQKLFDELNEEFNFDIDLCATAENSKCPNYCRDYLTYDLSELKRVDDNTISAFMNPPYSNPKPFIEKAWEDSKYCKIVCLIKCDPSTSMWNIFYDFENKEVGREYEKFLDGINYYRDFYTGNIIKSVGTKSGCEIRLINKRIRFIPPEGMEYCRCSTPRPSKDMKFINEYGKECIGCKECGYHVGSGPSFPSCLLIFDR